jgi:hypothetical protein
MWWSGPSFFTTQKRSVRLGSWRRASIVAALAFEDVRELRNGTLGLVSRDLSCFASLHWRNKEQVAPDEQMPAARKALNEGRFRDANEELERVGQELGVGADGDSLLPFVCECPMLECTKIVQLTLREYEHVRSSGRGGLAAVGHEDLSIERVMAQNNRFVRTEKFGEAGDVHAEADPRGEGAELPRLPR